MWWQIHGRKTKQIKGVESVRGFYFKSNNREGLEVIFEQSSEWKKEMGHEHILARAFLDEGDSIYQVPEARVCLACLGNSQEPRVVGMEPAVSKQ